MSYILRGHRLKFPNNYALQSLNIVFILANSAGPDEMLHVAAFHLGLHCLPKYPFMVSSKQRVNLVISYWPSNRSSIKCIGPRLRTCIWANTKLLALLHLFDLS